MATNTKLRDQAVSYLIEGREVTETLTLMAAHRLARIEDTKPRRDWRTYPAAADAVAPELGAVVWVPAFGRERRGIVTKVTPTKAHVAYVAPSNPTDIKVVVAEHRHIELDQQATPTTVGHDAGQHQAQHGDPASCAWC